MDFRLKQRLVGAAVLVSLAVVFLPIVLDGPHGTATELDERPVPPKPSEFLSPAQPMAELGAIDPQPEPRRRDSVPAPRSERPSEASESRVPGGSASKKDLKAWAIQVGSFTSEKNAEKLQADLRAKGFPAFVEQASGDGSVVYRVRVGPELLRKRVDAMRAEIEDSFKLKTLVVHYP